MHIIELEGESEEQRQRLAEEFGYNYEEDSLGVFEEAHLRISWNDLLGNEGIFVGDKRTIRIEAKTRGAKAFLKIIVAAYHSEKMTDMFMEGHKYVQIHCWPQSNPPLDPRNPTDEERNRISKIWIYEGHDSDGSDFLTIMSNKFHQENKC